MRPPGPVLPHRLAALAVLSGLAAGACRDAPAGAAAATPGAAPAEARSRDGAWPPLPRSSAAARALVAGRARRPLEASPAAPPTAREILEALAFEGSRRVVAGRDAVVRALRAHGDEAARAGRDSYILFGTHHDAAEQLEALRWLLGPAGLPGLSVVAVEQFAADGAWAEAPPEHQRGDDEALAAFAREGGAEAFGRLESGQRKRNYTALKFGYVGDVLDLVVSARGAGVPLVGCDMPPSLQGLAGLPHEELARLREVHCALALKRALERAPSPRRALVAWGMAHVSTERFRRLLPTPAAVKSIYVFGQRAGDGTVEAELASRLVLFEPALVPLDEAGRAAALLLPDPRLGGEVDRVRARLAVEDGPAPAGGLLLASSEAPATLHFAGRKTELVRAPANVEVPGGAAPGEATFVATSGGRAFVGLAWLAAPGRAELALDPARRSVRIVALDAGPGGAR